MTKAVTSLLEQGFNSPEVSNSVVKGFHDMSLKMADSFTDAFMEIIDQGKSFEQSMGDMVRRIAVEWERELLSKMFKQGANWLTNAIFGGVGIGSDGLANMGDFNQPTTIAAANGGIFPGSFQAFANGGVASRPTVGLIAEAGRPEAVVPLPNGRSIPVQMQGASRPQEVKSTTVVVFDRQQLSQLRTGKNEIINYVVADLRANGPIRQSIKRTI
jgi:phage-related minor tail protein